MGTQIQASEHGSESDLFSALEAAMDGNLSLSKRRDLLNAYTKAVEDRAGSEAHLASLRDRAEACEAGKCVHAVAANKAESDAGMVRNSLVNAVEYLDDRDGLNGTQVARLRSMLDRALG
ncbi:hypothetical protein [Streptomyces sp. NPDC046862]|uniref:hypothetical protein n=1 Tax=Streptomyces sp. NPDC046862 TaxID=3154603 RepID=UPI003455B696